jgi:hypothetical protein
MSEPIDIDRICAEQSLWLTRLEHWLAGYCEAQRVLSRADLFPDRWAFFEHPRPGDDLPIRRQFCPSVPTTRCEPREVSDAKQLLGRIFGLSPLECFPSSPLQVSVIGQAGVLASVRHSLIPTAAVRSVHSCE